MRPGVTSGLGSGQAWDHLGPGVILGPGSPRVWPLPQEGSGEGDSWEKLRGSSRVRPGAGALDMCGPPAGAELGAYGLSCPDGAVLAGTRSSSWPGASRERELVQGCTALQQEGHGEGVWGDHSLHPGEGL